MDPISQRLRQFERRVRLVRSWKGLAIGAFAGAVLAGLWALIDWAGWLYTEWLQLGLLVAASAVAGAVIGFALRVPRNGLSDSIDRRAGLANRLGTAMERQESDGIFDSDLRADAQSKLESVSPSSVYPISLSRWHAGAALSAVLAASIFMLGNTPLLLTDEAKKERAAVQKQGGTVERIRKEALEDPRDHELTEAERQLDEELRHFQRDLEKARMSKEEALQKSNELAQKADELMRQSIEKTQQNLAQAQTAFEKLQNAALDKANLAQVDPALAQMSTAERQEAIKQNQEKIQSLERQIRELKNRLAEIDRKLASKGLSEAERKQLEELKNQLEAQLKELMDQLKEAEELAEALKLSEEAMKVFQKMMEHPLYKELQELAKKLAENNAEAEATGRPKLTKEERLELQKRLEELAKQLADDKAMQEYLEALLEAMKNSGGT